MSFLPLDFSLNHLNNGSDCEMDDALHSMDSDIPTFSQDSDPESFLSAHDSLSRSSFLTDAEVDESLDLCDDGVTIPDMPECQIPAVQIPAVNPSPGRRAPFKNITCSRLNIGIEPSTPVTPTKPSDLANDPLTPTANLKVLISAASPEIRNRDNKKKELFQSEQPADLSEVPDMPEEEYEIEPSEELEESEPKYEEVKQMTGGRKDKSLGLLCSKFLDRFPEYTNPDVHVELCLDEVAKELGVERRRIYDIVNVLESVEIVSRIAKNRYAWYGKNYLKDTLSRLKAMGEEEGYAKKIKRMKDVEIANDASMFEKSENDGKLLPQKEEPGTKQLLQFTPYGGVLDLNTETSMALMAAKAMLRKDKSLGIMSQKFLMLFLVSQPKVVNLEIAAKILLGDPTIDSSESSKFKTKIRRLYDIANILSSLNLIRKVHVTALRGRKPAFQYIGPKVAAIKKEIDAPGKKKVAIPKSRTMKTSGDRVGALKREPSKSKKRFGRHASFDMICQAAAEERSKLYSSQPTRPATAQNDVIQPCTNPAEAKKLQLRKENVPPPAPKQEQKAVTYYIINHDQPKKENMQPNVQKPAKPFQGREIIIKVTNPGVKNKSLSNPLSHDEIKAVLKSLSTTPSSSYCHTCTTSTESKFVDAATQFSPQQTNILSNIAKQVQVSTPVTNSCPQVMSNAVTCGEPVKRILEEQFPSNSLGEPEPKKFKVAPTLEEIQPSISFMSSSPDIESSPTVSESAQRFETPEILSAADVVANLPIISPSSVPEPESEVTMQMFKTEPEHISLFEKAVPIAEPENPVPPVHKAVLRISPDVTDNSNSQDAEVARINMPVLERTKLITKNRPSPLRALHLEPEFRDSPPLHQLPRFTSQSQSPQLLHRVTEKDLELASPLLGQFEKKAMLLSDLNPVDFPVISPSETQNVKPKLLNIPSAIPQSLYNDIVMPLPLSPSNFSPSLQESRGNSVFSFASSTSLSNTPDFEIRRLAQSTISSPAVLRDQNSVIAQNIPQVAPVVSIADVNNLIYTVPTSSDANAYITPPQPIRVITKEAAFTPRSTCTFPSAIQQQYSTPIQNLALANAMRMTYHSNISGLTPAQTIGTPLAFTPITAVQKIATPGTFFRSTPGSMYPIQMTSSEKLSDGFSATLIPGGGYVFPFKKDLIPVRKLSMPKDNPSS